MEKIDSNERLTGDWTIEIKGLGKQVVGNSSHPYPINHMIASAAAWLLGDAVEVTNDQIEGTIDRETRKLHINRF